MIAKSTKEQHEAALYAATLTLRSFVPLLEAKGKSQVLESVNKYSNWYGKKFVWSELSTVLESKGILFEDIEDNDQRSILNEDWINK